jgi:Rod binding domain-containing protein
MDSVSGSFDSSATLAAGTLGALGVLSKSKNITKEQAEIAAKDFEAMFLSQMLEPMFGESVGNEAFGSEESQEIYKSMMVNEYGKQIANAGGIGIASYVKESLMRQSLLKLQEVK